MEITHGNIMDPAENPSKIAEIMNTVNTVNTVNTANATDVTNNNNNNNDTNDTTNDTTDDPNDTTSCISIIKIEKLHDAVNSKKGTVLSTDAAGNIQIKCIAGHVYDTNDGVLLQNWCIIC